MADKKAGYSEPRYKTVKVGMGKGFKEVPYTEGGETFLPAQKLKYHGRDVVFQEVQDARGNFKHIVVGGYDKGAGATKSMGDRLYTKVDVIENKAEASGIRESLEKNLGVKKKDIVFLT